MPDAPKKPKRRRGPLSGLRPVATADDLRALARRRFLPASGSASRSSPPSSASRAPPPTAAPATPSCSPAEVIAEMVEDTFHRTPREARGRGAERIVDVTAAACATSRPQRRIAPSSSAIRRRRSGSSPRRRRPVQARTIALNERLIEEEIESGALQLPVDAHTMAYALVRIARVVPLRRHDRGREARSREGVEILGLMLR